MRYRLRTLLILVALLPPLMAWGWMRYAALRAEQERSRLELAAMRQRLFLLRNPSPAMVAQQAAQRAALMQAMVAELMARQAAQKAAIEAELLEDRGRVERLQRAGYLPAHANR